MTQIKCYYKLHLILVKDCNLKPILGTCTFNTVYISRNVDHKKEMLYEWFEGDLPRSHLSETESVVN